MVKNNSNGILSIKDLFYISMCKGRTDFDDVMVRKSKLFPGSYCMYSNTTYCLKTVVCDVTMLYTYKNDGLRFCNKLTGNNVDFPIGP